MIERRWNFSAISFADRYILNASLEINDAEEECWAISFLVALTSSLFRNIAKSLKVKSSDALLS